MRNKTSQTGFTLIELIAVMVILGILAAVIIPRITTLTSGAYESNVRSMYGVIKNEVAAQALKAAMSGGSGGHRETYPVIETSKPDNWYLDNWVADYDPDMWKQTTDAAAAGMGNTNKKSGGTATTPWVTFTYAPHGLSSGDVEDWYHIVYMPITTTKGEVRGYDFDGYIMFAVQDGDLDGTNETRMAIDGTTGLMTVTAGSGEVILEDLNFISMGVLSTN